MEEYSGTDVELAFCELQRSGLPASGEPCHSPMIFLAKAIGEVLLVARAKAEKLAERAAKRKAEIAAMGAVAVNEEAERIEWECQEREFCQRFVTSEEQMAEIGDCVREQFLIPGLKRGGRLRLGGGKSRQKVSGFTDRRAQAIVRLLELKGKVALPADQFRQSVATLRQTGRIGLEYALVVAFTSFSVLLLGDVG